MKKAFFSTCLWLLLQALGLLEAQGQDMDLVRSHLDSLCSPRMAGRGYVAQGDKKAAHYLARHYNRYGLKKFRESYYQYFPLSVNTFPGDMRLCLGFNKLEPGAEYIASSMASGGKGSAGFFRVDSLMFFADGPERQAFMEAPVERKALVYPAAWRSRLASLPRPVVKQWLSAEVHVETHPEGPTALYSTYQGGPPSFQVVDSLMPQGKRRVWYKLDADFKKDYKTQNVIGYVEGTAQPDSFIVFSAHYDHMGQMGDIYFPGANDNASGTALLLELARYYSQNPPRYSIAFMAFGGEEVGLVGSRFYVHHPLFPLNRIRCVLNLDLTSAGSEGLAVVNAKVFRKDFRPLKALNDSLGYFPRIKQRGSAANSDHYYFSQENIPSFFLYTMGGPSAYHDIYDRPENLPLTKFSELFDLLHRYAGHLQKPKN